MTEKLQNDAQPTQKMDPLVSNTFKQDQSQTEAETNILTTSGRVELRLNSKAKLNPRVGF